LGFLVQFCKEYNSFWFMKKVAIFVLLFTLVLGGCVEKEPSIAKVYVRNLSNQLLTNFEVILVAQSNSPSFNETRRTNASGYATFDLQPVFDQLASEKNPTADFRIMARTPSDGIVTLGTLRARRNVIAVENVVFGF
jgi:hypothetical protein